MCVLLRISGVETCDCESQSHVPCDLCGPRRPARHAPATQSRSAAAGKPKSNGAVSPVERAGPDSAPTRRPARRPRAPSTNARACTPRGWSIVPA